MHTEQACAQGATTDPVTLTTIDDVASIYKAAGDSLRLKILWVLQRGSYGVLELTEMFDTKQSGMSHHLKILATAKLVETRREGNSIFYRSATVKVDDPLFDLKVSILASVEQLACSDALTIALAAIHQQRSELSRRFFSDNAAMFAEQSELIAEFPVYGPQAVEMLKQAPLAHRRQAIEVGPGQGEMLVELSQLFDQVLALDNSDAMLSQARTLCETKQLNNIQYLCDDTSGLPSLARRYDCAVMNMVLHHTPAPQQVLLDVANTLERGGILLITDLCPHEQHWAKDNCGDLWMGFDPAELTSWAEQAQLKEEHSSYLALRNGFQIQIRLFIKK